MREMIFSVLALIVFSLTTQGQGIEFFKGSWEEAVAMAKKEEKVIFVDAYATWCGPCKRMAKNVFTDNKVGDFYNKNFINVKLDMEKGDGLKFRQKYPVSAFPTLYYIDYTGDVVQKIKGALRVDDFINAGKNALKGIDRSAEFEAAYNEGDRSPELVHDYIKALNQAGRSSLKVTNEYLRDQENLNAEENLRVIYEGTVEADSRIFKLLIERRKAIELLYSKREVAEKIFDACNATVDKAVEYRSETLLEESIKKAQKHVPEMADAFEAEAKIKYYLDKEDAKAYLKACKKLSKTFDPDDRKAYHDLANSIMQNFPKNSKAGKMAEKMARKAAEGGDNLGYFLTYSSILLHNGKDDKALDAAMKAKTLAEQSENRSVKLMVDEFIQKLSK